MCDVLKQTFLLSKRYVLGGMGLLAMAIAFTMRVALSMTITQMVVKRVEGSPVKQFSKRVGDVAVRSQKYYEWSEATQGLLLSAFYYGYVLTHLPGNILAKKFGGKRTVGYGLLIMSVATLITPYVISIGGILGLFVIRFIKGCAEGPVAPAFVHLMARWIPPEEQSFFGAIILRGDQFGNIFGPYISGLILDNDGDWANVFYTFGSFGIIWFIFWTLFCYDSPNSHPYISDSELKFLNTHIEASRTGEGNNLDPTPVKAIKRSRPFWVLAIAAHGHNWGYFAMLIHLPKYFHDVLKFDITETGYLTMLPFIGMYLSSYFFARTCQFCIDKGYHSANIGRKIYATISSVVPAVFIMVASYEVDERYCVVAYFIWAMAFMGAVYTSIKIYPIDLAPNYNGPCSAIVNGLAATSGIITPTLIGLLTPDQTIEQWRIAFWIIIFVLISTNIVYLIWGSGEQEWWDDVDKYGYPENWKHGLLERRSEV